MLGFVNSLLKSYLKIQIAINVRKTYRRYNVK